MHPLSTRKCDEMFENPALATPPPEPEKPKEPRPRKPRVFKVPPKFPLVPAQFYEAWVNHQKELQMMTPLVDNKPPELFPELYLKPRRLDFYAKLLEANMKTNKTLIKKINQIHRTHGFVDCWNKPQTNNYSKLLTEQRQRHLNIIRKKNIFFRTRLLNAKSEQPTTKEFDVQWKNTKEKLILGASLPFILFKKEKIDRGYSDPAFEPKPGVIRSKVMLDVRVVGGAKMGRVVIELFSDIMPKTCKLFVSLIKGDSRGHAYTGTRIFRIVPNLYCRAGDVVKDNGFGCYNIEGQDDPIPIESFKLNHSVPGVLSMVVNSDKEVTGQFNIMFKPLPQFNGKHSVFGRIVSGPAQFLERLSAQGLPLGSTSADLVIHQMGYFTPKGEFRDGGRNTIEFPPRGHRVNVAAGDSK